MATGRQKMMEKDDLQFILQSSKAAQNIAHKNMSNKPSSQVVTKQKSLRC